MRRTGWFRESYRHSLASKGIKTNRQMSKTLSSTKRQSMAYVASDLPLIGADAVGTVGAAGVALAPLAVAAGVVYMGGKFIKSEYDKDKKALKRTSKADKSELLPVGKPMMPIRNKKRDLFEKDVEYLESVLDNPPDDLSPRQLDALHEELKMKKRWLHNTDSDRPRINEKFLGIR